jgi:hypothetical protein
VRRCAAAAALVARGILNAAELLVASGTACMWQQYLYVSCRLSAWQPSLTHACICPQVRVQPWPQAQRLLPHAQLADADSSRRCRPFQQAHGKVRRLQHETACNTAFWLQTRHMMWRSGHKMVHEVWKDSCVACTAFPFLRQYGQGKVPFQQCRIDCCVDAAAAAAGPMPTRRLRCLLPSRGRTPPGGPSNW